MPAVAVATEHDDILRQLKSATRVRFVVDVELSGERIDGARVQQSPQRGDGVNRN